MCSKTGSRNYLSPISIFSDLSHAEPDQRRNANDDSIPGERRETIARDDGEEGLDHRPGDDERDERADRDQAEIVGGDRVAMLEQLEHGGAGQRRKREEEAELGGGLAVDPERHRAEDRRSRPAETGRSE